MSPTQKAAAPTADKNNPLYPWFVAGFVLLLLLSIHGVKYIPYWNFRGLDLQNLWTFHHQCPGWPVPYEKTGAMCGDALGRGLVYPPLVYWLMAWTKLVDFYPATVLWDLSIVGLTLLGTGFVATADSTGLATNRRWNWAVWLLLLPQMPMVYALERGNNDALVIPIFALAVLAFVRGRVMITGALLATACWTKVYPVIPSFVLIAALALDPDLRTRYFTRFFGGFVVGGIGWAIVLFPDSYRYVFQVLPVLAQDGGGFGLSSHTLFRGLPSLAVKLPALGLWIFWTRRMLARDPVLALTAGLAISTFFQNLSNDYNLITTYPFLFVVLDRLLDRRMRGVDFAILVLTFAAFVGDRTPMEILFKNRGALFTQLVWFFAFPFYVLNRIDKGRWAGGNPYLR